MSATYDSVADIEIAAITVNDEGGNNGVEVAVNVVEENGVGGRRRRRRRRGYRWYGGYRPEGVDLESGELEAKVHSAGNHAKRCRICHLNFERGGGDDDDDDDNRGYAMELGCDCKGDLGTAHQQCAVTWFLIRGTLNCEICGAIAKNLCFQPIEEVNYDAAAAEVQTPEPEPEREPEPEPTYVSPRVTEPVTESETSVYSRWFVKGVLTCMVIAFVVSSLIHYNNLERSD